jgi:hypothetical protein
MPSRPLVPPALALLACLLGLAPAHATHVILQADFDDEPLDQPIQTGGATVGEPVAVSSTISAIVRAWPFPTPSLKINDDDLLDPGFVRFHFLDSDSTVDHGIVEISATLWFTNLEEYAIRVRERRANSRRFLDLAFGSSGIVVYKDQDTLTYQVIGTYEAGRPLSLVIRFDMDAATYSVRLDGTTLLADEPHGALPPYQGIGAVLFGMEADDDPHGEFNLDDLVVTADETTPVAAVSWAATKVRYR